MDVLKISHEDRIPCNTKKGIHSDKHEDDERLYPRRDGAPPDVLQALISKSCGYRHKALQVQ